MQTLCKPPLLFPPFEGQLEVHYERPSDAASTSALMDIKLREPTAQMVLPFLFRVRDYLLGGYPQQATYQPELQALFETVATSYPDYLQTIKPTTQQASQMNSSANGGGGGMFTQATITDASLFLLENSLDPCTEAFHITLPRFTFFGRTGQQSSSASSSSLDFAEMTAAFCNMDAVGESRLECLMPFSVSMVTTTCSTSGDSGSGPTAITSTTNTVITPLSMAFSYQDAAMLQSVWNQFTAKQPAPAPSKAGNSTEARPNPNPKQQPNPNSLSNQSTLRLDGLHVTFIDDFSPVHLPLLELIGHDLVYHTTSSTTNEKGSDDPAAANGGWEAKGVGHFALNSFNRTTSHWEPLMESLRLQIIQDAHGNVTISPQDSKKTGDFGGDVVASSSFFGMDSLQLVLSHSFVQTLSSIYSAKTHAHNNAATTKQSSVEGEDGGEGRGLTAKRSFAKPYRIVNLTGWALKITPSSSATSSSFRRTTSHSTDLRPSTSMTSLASASTASNTTTLSNFFEDGPEGAIVEPEQSLPWVFQDWRSPGATDDAARGKLDVQLVGSPWCSVKRVGVDRPGIHLYTLHPIKSPKPVLSAEGAASGHHSTSAASAFVAVCVTLDHKTGCKEVVIRSPVLFANRCQHALEITDVSSSTHYDTDDKNIDDEVNTAGMNGKNPRGAILESDQMASMGVRTPEQADFVWRLRPMASAAAISNAPGNDAADNKDHHPVAKYDPLGYAWSEQYVRLSELLASPAVKVAKTRRHLDDQLDLSSDSSSSLSSESEAESEPEKPSHRKGSSFLTNLGLGKANPTKTKHCGMLMTCPSNYPDGPAMHYLVTVNALKQTHGNSSLDDDDHDDSVMTGEELCSSTLCTVKVRTVCGIRNHLPLALLLRIKSSSSSCRSGSRGGGVWEETVCVQPGAMASLPALLPPGIINNADGEDGKQTTGPKLVINVEIPELGLASINPWTALFAPDGDDEEEGDCVGDLALPLIQTDAVKGARRTVNLVISRRVYGGGCWRAYLGVPFLLLNKTGVRLFYTCAPSTSGHYPGSSKGRPSNTALGDDTMDGTVAGEEGDPWAVFQGLMPAQPLLLNPTAAGIGDKNFLLHSQPSSSVQKLRVRTEHCQWSKSVGLLSSTARDLVLPSSVHHEVIVMDRIADHQAGHSDQDTILAPLTLAVCISTPELGRRGQGGMVAPSRIITLLPRFILVNRLAHTLLVRYTVSGVVERVLPSGQLLALKYLNSGGTAPSQPNTTLLQFAILAAGEGENGASGQSGGGCSSWSVPYAVEGPGPHHLKLQSSPSPVLLRLECFYPPATAAATNASNPPGSLTRGEGCVWVEVRKEDDTAWPISIDNHTPLDLIYYQRGCQSLACYVLPANGRVAYAWDRPQMPERRLIVAVADTTNSQGSFSSSSMHSSSGAAEASPTTHREIDLNQIGVCRPLTMKRPSLPEASSSSPKSNIAVVNIEVRREGPVAVVILTSDSNDSQSSTSKQMNSLRMTRAAQSAQRQSTRHDMLHGNYSTAKEDDDAVATNVETPLPSSVQSLWTVKFAGVGVSVVDHHCHELVYIWAKGVELRWSQSWEHTTYGLSVGWLQVDNQSFDWGEHPILLYPTATPQHQGKFVRSFVLSSILRPLLFVFRWWWE